MDDDKPIEDIMKMFRLGGKRAKDEKETIRYSELDLKKLSVEHKWKGIGTENDPFIVESSHPFSTEDIISITDSKLNMKFRNCVFNSIKIKKCTNLNFQECQIENLTITRSVNLSVNNCKIKYISIKASVHISIEDSTVKSLNLSNSFLNSIKKGSIQSITKIRSPDNLIDVQNISEEDKLKGNRFPANVLALISVITMFLITLSYIYFSILLDFNFIMGLIVSYIIIAILFSGMIVGVILIIGLNKKINIYYAEKRVVYPNLKIQILGGSLIILGIFFIDIFYTISILYFEIWFVDILRISVSIFSVLMISFLFSLGINLLIKARPFEKGTIKEGINPLYPLFIPSITFVIPLILLIGIGYSIRALRNMFFAVNLLFIISMSLFLLVSLSTNHKFKKLLKNDTKLSISQAKFRQVFGSSLFVVGFMLMFLSSELLSEETIGVYTYLIFIVILLFGLSMTFVNLGLGSFTKLTGSKPFSALRSYEKGDYEKALTQYQKMLEEDPKNTGLLNNLGAVYVNLGQFQNALDTFNQVLKLDQDSKHAWNGLGVVYCHLEEYDKSIEILEKALSISKKPVIASKLTEILAQSYLSYSIDDRIIYNLSNACRKKGDLNKAIETCEKGFKVNPKYEDLWELFGTIYLEKGEIDRCIEICEQCVKSNPKFEKVYNTLGIAYRNKHNPKKAIEALNKALYINPKNHQAYFNSAVIYLDLKEYRKALNACNLSLRFNPDNPGAIRLRAKIYEELTQN